MEWGIVVIFYIMKLKVIENYKNISNKVVFFY